MTMTCKQIAKARDEYTKLSDAAFDAYLEAMVVEEPHEAGVPRTPLTAEQRRCRERATALEAELEALKERWAREGVEAYEAVTGNRAMFAHPQWTKPDSGAIPFFTVAAVAPSDAPPCILVPGSGDFLQSDFDAACAFLRSQGVACDRFTIRVPSAYDDDCNAYESVSESADRSS